MPDAPAHICRNCRYAEWYDEKMPSGGTCRWSGPIAIAHRLQPVEPRTFPIGVIRSTCELPCPTFAAAEERENA